MADTGPGARRTRHTARVRRTIELRALALPVAGVLAFLLATNRWTAPKVWANDAISYGLMAHAAPGVPDGKVVGSAYAGRWIPHYLVGLLADATGFGPHTAYWIAGIAAVCALAIVAAVVFAALDAPPGLVALTLLAFVAAPYATPRETLLAPGLLQDEVFVLGLAICLAGLLRVRFGVVLAGALVALAGRQTMLPLLLIVAAWILIDDDWRAALDARRRRRAAATVVVSGLVLYAAILLVTAPFTYAFGPDSPSDTIILSPPGAARPGVARRPDARAVRRAAGDPRRDLSSRGRAPGRRGATSGAKRGCASRCGRCTVLQPLVIAPKIPGVLVQ